MPFAFRCRLTVVCSAILCLLGHASARAQDASAWQKDTHAEARLIAGALIETPDASFMRAGIEIRLDPGWKTYWRYPGDSGVPPTFDFAGSKNVKSAAVQWPAPERFPDGAGGSSIGYVGDVILPLKITPADVSQPSVLHLTLKYAVCGTLCVPAEALLQLPLTGKSADEAILDSAERQVPKRVALGADSANALAILSVRREPGGAHDKVIVDLAAPAGDAVQLFAEGPTPDWALPLPVPAGPATGPARRFTFDLDGLPPGAKAKGATLTFTAVSGENAIEVPVHLD
ncbi:MAG: protein-disulfide reductase DsbD domain-containing protein [Xanthobacteraceae bacterium]